MLKPLVSGLVLGVLVASGCKPSGSSTVKSLDNFAAGKNLHLNVCAAPDSASKNERMPLVKQMDIAFSGKTAESNKSALKSALHETLAALPGEFLLMFAGLDTRFLITDEAVKTCSASFEQKSESRADIESCNLFALDAQNPQLTIILPADSAMIRHDAIKALGLAFSQSLSRITQGSSKKIKLLDGPASSQIASERALTNTFLYDLYLMNNNAVWFNFVSNYFDIQNKETLAGYLTSKPLNEQTLSDNDIVSQLSFISENHKKRLFSLVFAHTWDSFYCNSNAPFNSKHARDAYIGNNSMSEKSISSALKNTKKVLEDFFPVTYSKFSEIEKILKARAQFIFEVANMRGPLDTTVSANASSTFQISDDPDAYKPRTWGRDGTGVIKAATRWRTLPDQYRQMLTQDTYEDQMYSRGARSVMRYNGINPSTGSQGLFSNPFAGSDHIGDQVFRSDAQRLDILSGQLGFISNPKKMQIPETLEAYRVPFAQAEVQRYNEIAANKRFTGSDISRQFYEFKPELGYETGAGVKVVNGVPVPEAGWKVSGKLGYTAGGERTTTVGSFVPPDPYISQRFDQFVRQNPQIGQSAAMPRVSPSAPVIVSGAIPSGSSSNQWVSSSLPNQSSRTVSPVPVSPRTVSPAPSRPSGGSSSAPPLVPIR